MKLGNILGRLFGLGLIILMILGIGAAIYGAGAWQSIGPGEAGIVVSQISGTISEPRLGPTSGFMVNGFYRLLGQEYVVTIPYKMVKENSIGMWGNGTDKFADYPAIPCFSKDQLEVNIDVYARWELDTNKLVALYRNYPTLNWKNTIASILREQIRIMTSTQWTAVETIANRGLVRDAIFTAIWTKIQNEPSLLGAVLNFEFELRNIGYPPDYTKSIEEKMASEQKMMQAEYEKRTVIIQAEGEAQKIMIQATAMANATLVKAESFAQAIYDIAYKTGTDPATIAQTYLFFNLLPANATLIISPEGTPFIWQMP